MSLDPSAAPTIEGLESLDEKFGNTTFGSPFKNPGAGSQPTQSQATSTNEDSTAVAGEETKEVKPEIPEWAATMATAQQVELQRIREDITRQARVQPQQPPTPQPQFQLNPEDVIQGKHLQALMEHMNGQMKSVGEQAAYGRFAASYANIRSKYPDLTIDSNQAQQLFNSNGALALNPNTNWEGIIETMHKANAYQNVQNENAKLKEQLKKIEQKQEQKANRQMVPSSATSGIAPPLNSTYAPDYFQSQTAGGRKRPMTISDYSSKLRRQFAS